MDIVVTKNQCKQLPKITRATNQGKRPWRFNECNVYLASEEREKGEECCHLKKQREEENAGI